MQDAAGTDATSPCRRRPDTRRIMETEATTLWVAYQKDGDESAREQIIEQNLPLVYHIARKIMRNVGHRVDLDELVNAGCIGLMNAVDSFDAERGLAFSTFAVPRIRGAIIDDLRRSDDATRSTRRRQREIAEAEKALSGTLDRTPGDRETAQHIGVDIETLWRWKKDAREAARISLDRPAIRTESDGPTIGDLIAGATGEEVENRITQSEEMEVMRDEILRLNERERIVLSLYYFEDLKLREIAEVLGLTESRVSQIRTKTLRTLRDRMAHLREGV